MGDAIVADPALTLAALLDAIGESDRNGHRPRMLTTKAGDVELRIPKLRKGSFLPVILEPRRRIDQALYAVVMEAYVHGVSTRSVDDLVEAALQQCRRWVRDTPGENEIRTQQRFGLLIDGPAVLGRAVIDQIDSEAAGGLAGDEHRQHVPVRAGDERRGARLARA